MLVTILLSSVTMTLIPSALGYHQATANVYWLKTVSPFPVSAVGKTLTTDPVNPNDTYATTAAEMWGNPSSLKPVVIVVTNNATGVDPITGVEVIINQNETGQANFNLKQGLAIDEDGAPAALWYAQVLETDDQGWVRTIRFQTALSDDGIGNEGSHPLLYFYLYFSEGQSSCNYKFTVWTHDLGDVVRLGRQSHRHYLWLAMDSTAPRITPEYPLEGSSIEGLIEPCGTHGFWLNFTADDKAPTATGVLHDTGLYNYSVYVDNLPLNASVLINYLPNSTLYYRQKVSTKYFWNLYNGQHNYTITVWDGIYNKATITVKFNYTRPPVPLTISPEKGYAAPTTYIVNNTTGLVNSTQVIYKGKTLGNLTTLNGLQFGNSLSVSVRVYLPTYSSYFAQYGTYNVLVYQGTTNANGTFTASFVFPNAPAGVYNVSAKTAVMECAVWFEVLPEVIYKPDEVIGPALIEVMATGFTAQNTTRPSWFFIVPDALQGVNTQIDRWWFIDGNGTLKNWLNTYTVGVENVSTTLNWPWMQPGTYTVELKHIDGDWWNGTFLNWVRKPCFVGGNIITVDETLSLLIGIKADTAIIRTATDTIIANLTTLMPIVDRIDGNVVTINTTVGRIEANIDLLSPVITRIDGNVVTLNTTVGQINTTMATIGPQLAAINMTDIATIKTSVGTDLNGTVASIQGDVATIKTDAGEIKTQVPSLTTPIYIAVVFSIIAAIAAIACAFLVYRKIA